MVLNDRSGQIPKKVLDGYLNELKGRNLIEIEIKDYEDASYRQIYLTQEGLETIGEAIQNVLTYFFYIEHIGVIISHIRISVGFIISSAKFLHKVLEYYAVVTSWILYTNIISHVIPCLYVPT
jgi:hypothetical protein